MAHSTNLPNQDRVRVLAVDSTSMSTQLLVDALARNAQFQVIEAPPDEADLVSLVKRESPDVALLSAKIGQGGQVAYDLVRNVRAEQPSLRVVMLLDHSEPAAVVEAFRAGAHGIFCRTQPLRLLSKCIECVHAGQVWANSSELHFLLEALAKPALASFRHLGSSPLSARESDVVRCVAEGMTNREIARRLKLTEHTVKNYLFRIFDKLGVSSRVEVVLYALGNGDSRPAPPQNGRRSQAASATRRSAAAAVPSSMHETKD
jgi:two-component system, NarL family, nitrate/nitrite response regulator NarL